MELVRQTQLVVASRILAVVTILTIHAGARHRVSLPDLKGLSVGDLLVDSLDIERHLV